MTNNEYQKEYIRQVKFKLNRKTESDLIEWLDSQENTQKYLKDLVKSDMDNKKRQ